ncbi:MAG: hypothetical protein ACK55I_22365, partial [bacterium]
MSVRPVVQGQSDSGVPPSAFHGASDSIAEVVAVHEVGTTDGVADAGRASAADPAAALAGIPHGVVL